MEPQRGFSGGQSVVLSSFLTVHKDPANMSVGTRTKFIPYLRISSASINVKLLIVVIFAKDCLLTGQEQACTRITRLSFACHHAQKGLVHRKMAVHCPKVITFIGDSLFQTRPRMRNIWRSQSFAWLTLGFVYPIVFNLLSLFCVKMLPPRKYEKQFLCKFCQQLPIHIIYLLIFSVRT